MKKVFLAAFKNNLIITNGDNLDQYEVFENTNKLTQNLLVNLETFTNKFDFQFDEIVSLIVYRGPGNSYSSLRILASFANAIALSRNLELLSVDLSEVKRDDFQKLELSEFLGLVKSKIDSDEKVNFIDPVYWHGAKISKSKKRIVFEVKTS